jgi:sugar phosphate isomerase/epimerase
MINQAIRIGTMVDGAAGAAGYIRQILPHGFESFQIKFWQTLGETNLTRLAGEVNETLADSGAIVSSLAVFGNPLDPKASKHKETLSAWKKCIDSAELFGCNLVCGFAGRLIDRPIPESLPAYKKIFAPLAERAADKGVRLAFENCDMGGDWNRGDWNIAHTPDAWELMFDALPADNIGLEWEPCHQLVKLIDPVPQLRKWAGKVFHVHGKDASVYWDVVREHGVTGPKTFAHHRTPGFGDSNWTNLISILREGGFTGSIDIEGWHDPVYRGELEMTGQVHALNYLKRCRGGQIVENPK